MPLICPSAFPVNPYCVRRQALNRAVVDGSGHAPQHALLATQPLTSKPIGFAWTSKKSDVTLCNFVDDISLRVDPVPWRI